MKNNILVGILAAEAVICAVFCILQASLSGIFTAVAAFPFEQAGLGLRSLSLSGSGGNAAAVALYCTVCLLPVAVLLLLRRKRVLNIEDALLAVLSAVLFAVLYFMINPGIFASFTGGAASLTVGKAFLGGMVYSVLCGYLILRALRMFFSGGTVKLMSYMKIMLVLLSILFVYLSFGVCLDTMLDSFAALRTANTGNEHLLGITYVFLTLQFSVNALPYIINVFIILSALTLLRETQADRYSAETAEAAEKMSHLCAAALAVTVLSNIGFNLLQLLFVKPLLVINGSVEIPVFSITFVLAALLSARFAAENKQLKDDNDLIV